MHVYVFAQRINVIIDTLHRYVWTYSSGGATSCGPRFETESVLTYNLITLTTDFPTTNLVTGHSCLLTANFQFPIYALPHSTYVRYGTDKQVDR